MRIQVVQKPTKRYQPSKGKFEYVKQKIQEGCLKSSWYFKVVHWFLHVSLLCFTYTNLGFARSMRSLASHRHYKQLAFKIEDFNKQGCAKTNARILSFTT